MEGECNWSSVVGVVHIVMDVVGLCLETIAKDSSICDSLNCGVLQPVAVPLRGHPTEKRYSSY